MTPAQRQAIIALLDPPRIVDDGLHHLDRGYVVDIVETIVDGPLAPVIQALAAIADDHESGERRCGACEVLDALDPAWLGEP